ncbi:MAG: hypothetical protein HYY06_29170 [Deltaproteobacteria bacterium]|nr:hypothetical protein [Deltaproteobacteria bacterium]
MGPIEPTMPWEGDEHLSRFEVRLPDRDSLPVNRGLSAALGAEPDADLDLEADPDLVFTPPWASAEDLAGAHEHVGLLPREIAEKHLVLPFRVDDNRIHLAMADSKADRIVEELGFVTGKTVVRSVTDGNTLRQAIADAYGTANQADATRRALGFRIAPSRNSSRAFASAVVLPDGTH